MSASIEPITIMEIIKHIHYNGGQWATQDMTLHLVQKSGQSEFKISFGTRKSEVKSEER